MTSKFDPFRYLDGTDDDGKMTGSLWFPISV